MTRLLLCLALLMPALPAIAQDYLPRDVQRFMDRREGCDQLRREIPDSSEKLRMKDANRGVLRVCIGTDRELVQLKRKYARNSTIMQILNQFESGIELAEAPAPKARSQK